MNFMRLSEIKRQLSILSFAARTHWTKDQSPARRPEPEAIMDDPAQAQAFHEEGEKLLAPLYLFNAEAISTLTPFGGVVLDLGSGSGQFLKTLAKTRPDLSIIGVDLSASMLEIGKKALEHAGLNDRVKLIHGDMTQIDRLDLPRVDTVSSIFSLHHLPDAEILSHCLQSILKMRARTGCAGWIFDHSPPKSIALAERFPEVFNPESPLVFKKDSTHSILASYPVGAIASHLGDWRFATPRFLPYYQAHWTGTPRRESTVPGGTAEFFSKGFEAHSLREFRRFKALWRNLP